MLALASDFFTLKWRHYHSDEKKEKNNNMEITLNFKAPTSIYYFIRWVMMAMRGGYHVMIKVIFVSCDAGITNDHKTSLFVVDFNKLINTL